MNAQTISLPAAGSHFYRSNSLLNVAFVKTAPADSELLAEFTDPCTLYASATLSAMPANLGTCKPAQDNQLLVLLLASGSGTTQDQRQSAELWMVKQIGDRQEATVELLMMSDRILWRPGRAVLIASPERFATLLPALIEFTCYEYHLRSMECELDSCWSQAESDISLIHQVGQRDLQRWRDVNRMSALSKRNRICYVRLEARLEKASTLMPVFAQRIFHELSVQVDVVHRLQSVDDKIEVLEDLYESANDRLSEYSYFIREWRLEVIIIVVLVTDLLVRLYDFLYL